VGVQVWQLPPLQNQPVAQSVSRAHDVLQVAPSAQSRPPAQGPEVLLHDAGVGLSPSHCVILNVGAVSCPAGAVASAPFVQVVALPHRVPLAAGWQPPNPSQPSEQEDLSTGQPLIESSVPAGSAAQVPVPAPQRWQAPQPATLQQTPSVHHPELHWLGLVQEAPLDCGEAQTPPLQNSDAPQVVPLQQS
jgi:hypothetical protein